MSENEYLRAYKPERMNNVHNMLPVLLICNHELLVLLYVRVTNPTTNAPVFWLIFIEKIELKSRDACFLLRKQKYSFIKRDRDHLEKPRGPLERVLQRILSIDKNTIGSFPVGWHTLLW